MFHSKCSDSKLFNVNLYFFLISQPNLRGELQVHFLYILLKINAVEPVLGTVTRPGHFLHLCAPDCYGCNDAVGIDQEVI